ncbi:sodium:solute symporter family transporter [Thaumasiovibrio subtropicus]|uniref:sodium:solute symporter family transporter n=1 Tax=Thaumasiovibrio subtropicus TaxID=1891207 RepID=UPI000B360B5B|nr:transporter [Thaumasiovibrio subtropicus]
MNTIDLMIVGGYFGFILIAALIFKRFSKDSSGFIKGGGAMMWWMAGATAFMTQFSAWTFTGAAAKAYEDGLTVLFIFWGNAIGFFVAAWYFAGRFRQLRVDTPMEVIRQRFGKVSEQIFTWLQFPLTTFSIAIWLNGLAIFVSAVFGIELSVTIIGVGVIVTLISVAGGSWTVSATNVIQLILLMAITMVAGGYALYAAGGPAELVRDYPSTQVLGDSIQYWQIGLLWIFFMFTKQTISTNNAMTCYRFLVTVNEREARKAALVTGLLFVIGPVMWFVPPWVSATHGVDLAAIYPTLGNDANNAAYVYFVEHHMPNGVLGLILAAMIAATISPMTTALNRNAGIFVRNVYQSLINPNARDAQQLVVGKVVTVVNGVVAIWAALLFASMEEYSFFDLMMLFGALLQTPLAIPALLAVVVTRTPAWSGWATLLVGLMVSAFMQFVFEVNWLLPLFNAERFTGREAVDLMVIASLTAHIVITGGFFLLSSRFYRESHTQHHQALTHFVSNLATPISLDEEAAVDGRQGLYLGKLTQALGVGVGLLVFAPNLPFDRVAFLLIGGLIFTAGAGLRRPAPTRHSVTE